MSRSSLRLILESLSRTPGDDDRGCIPPAPGSGDRGCIPPAPGSGDGGCYPPKPSVSMPSRLARSRRNESRRA
jgi:hypothetical protein